MALIKEFKLCVGVGGGVGHVHRGGARAQSFRRVFHSTFPARPGEFGIGHPSNHRMYYH
jgi:hypothetical protein